MVDGQKAPGLVPVASAEKQGIQPFLDFGLMPIANGFRDPADESEEARYPLRVGFDPDLSLVRLLEQPPPEAMFNERYAFHSSTSARMAEHFRELAQAVDALSNDGLIVELGCNDGILLRHLKHRRHLGIEPSANVAAIARSEGVNVLESFFDQDTADRIKAEHGQASVIVAANVMCHVPDPLATLRACASLLHPDGVVLFEDPYLGDIIERCSFDQIYDEHASYFSVTSVAKLAEQAGLEVIHVSPQSTHGGSMRYMLAKVGARVRQAPVYQRCFWEHERGIDDSVALRGFAERVDRTSVTLVALLRELVRGGVKIAGYGATSKSSTVLNYAGIGPALVDYIADTTPGKQGKLSPGMRIPVVPREHFLEHPPDYALLFAWNHRDEILEKERWFTEQGGRWIVYVPEVTVL